MTELSSTNESLIPPNPANVIAAKIWQYALDNPIKTAVTAVLVWGGLLMLMFFSRIGYMPDINLESATSLLYAIALLGSFVAAYTMLMMVAPGLLLANIKEPTEKITLLHLFCITFGATVIWIAVLLKIFGFLTIAWMWSAVILSALLFPWFGLQVSRKYPKAGEPVQSTSTKINPQDNPWKIYLWSLFAVIGIGVLITIPLLFISVIGLTGDIRTAPSWQAVIVLVALIALISSSAALIGGVKTSHVAKVATVFAPLLLFVVLAATGSFSFFSVLAVKVLGQGEISAARITVTGKTCQEINETLGQRICIVTTDDRATAICPVMIRSRIGSQVVLDFAPMGGEKSEAFWITSEGPHNGGSDEKTIRRVIIDKPKLLSWQPLKDFSERNRTQVVSTTLPLVATWLEPEPRGIDNKPSQSTHSLSKVLTLRCGDQPVVQGPLRQNEKQGDSNHEK